MGSSKDSILQGSPSELTLNEPSLDPHCMSPLWTHTSGFLTYLSVSAFVKWEQCENPAGAAEGGGQ